MLRAGHRLPQTWSHVRIVSGPFLFDVQVGVSVFCEPTTPLSLSGFARWSRAQPNLQEPRTAWLPPPRPQQSPATMRGYLSRAPRRTSSGAPMSHAILQALGLGESHSGTYLGHGEWSKTADAGAIESLNPATNEALAKVHASSAQDYETIVKRAQAAFETWRNTDRKSVV